MRDPRRYLAPILTVALLAAAGVPAAAQDPSPGTSPPDGAAAQAGGSLEGEVTYVDPEGVTRGLVMIRSAADPFTDFDPNGPPPEGARYIQLIATFEASEDQSFAAEPSYLVLQDADGFIYQPSYLPRPPDATPPDLQSQTLSPFDRVSGSLGYTVPAAKPIVRTVYRGDGQRLIEVSRAVASTTGALGEPTAVRTMEGVEQGSITIRAIEDPYTEHDPNQPPPEGQRFVLVDAVFEAAADQPMTADPYAMVLVDSTGILYYPTWVPRPPDEPLQNLDRQALSPGDRISGVNGYLLPQDVVVAGIVYAPEWNRYLPLAELAPGG